MSYIVNKTDGSILATILDGTTNTDTGLTLIGRNYTTYGEIQNENFVKLLENFANDDPPGVSVGFTPINGQLWWDTGNTVLKVYTDGNFVPVSQQTSSTTAPTIKAIGDQWWDKTNNQLKIWTGTAWQLIGPAYSTSQGKSGMFVETVEDVDANTHQVVAVYTKGTLVGIISDEDFSVSASLSTAGFDAIVSGFNLISTSKFNGTATNATNLNGIAPALYARRDQTNTFTSTARFNGGTLTLSRDPSILGANLTINTADNDLIIKNATYGANVHVLVSGQLGALTALTVNANTGEVFAPAEPQTVDTLTNKLYVDTRVDFLQDEINSVNDSVLAAVQQVFTDYVSNISSVVNSTNANLNATATGINGNVVNLNTQVNSGFQAANSAISSIDERVTSIEDFLPSLAPLNSPTFIGTPVTTTPPANDNSTRIATTSFVSAKASDLTNDYVLRITTLNNNLTNTINTGLASKAPSLSPEFAGTPTAPTAPAGTSTKQLATTAFVTQGIAAQKFNYTVSTGAPSGGNNGDFWFQIG